jgi:hypothetical protein
MQVPPLDSLGARRTGWIALLTVATIAGSFVFACATPFPAMIWFVPQMTAVSAKRTALSAPAASAVAIMAPAPMAIPHAKLSQV